MLLAALLPGPLAAGRVRRCSPRSWPASAGTFTVLLWNDVQDDGPKSLVGGRAGAGRLLALRHLHDLRGRAGVGAVPGRLPPPGRPRRRRGLRAHADVGGRRRDHGLGQRSHRALPRLRGALAGALRHGRQPAPPPREPGVRPQVLRARAASRPPSCSTASPWSTAPPGRTNLERILDLPGPERAAGERPAAGRHRAPARRAELQGGRRPVPHLDARRLPGRADAGHRVHGVGGQGRRVRGAAAGGRRRPGALRAGLAAGDLGPGRGDACSAAPCWPWCRRTSSGCWPTPRSATSGSSSSASRRRAGSATTATTAAPRPCSFYLLAYAVIVLGTFGVVTLVSRAHDGDQSLDAFRGLSRTRPVLALALTIFLLAQAGVPLTTGFVAKFGVIAAAVDAESYTLAVIAMAGLGHRRLRLPAHHREHVPGRSGAGRRRPAAGAGAASAPGSA